MYILNYSTLNFSTLYDLDYIYSYIIMLYNQLYTMITFFLNQQFITQGMVTVYIYQIVWDSNP